MKHLLISYHTCPTEQPGQDLAGGMNVLLTGYLRHTQVPTVVVTRSFGEDQELQLSASVKLLRLACGASRPWTRELAFDCLPEFGRRVAALAGDFDVVTAHYWMSATLLPDLGKPAGIMFHTLQAQKGAPRNALEETRQRWESRLIAAYPTAYLHWHDLNNARGHYPALRGTVLRAGLLFGEPRQPPPSPPWIYGWAARKDPIKNLDIALDWLRTQPPGCRLRVAGMEGENTPFVEYVGSLQHEKMPEFYGSIHQLLNLSAYETYGLSILEALACGTSVGVPVQSDWARRLRRLHLPFAAGTVYDAAERQRAARLALAHSWPRALPKWENWLRSLLRLGPPPVCRRFC